MSKSGKARKHDAKMRKRRTEKAAKRTAYAALAGTSKKKKKQVKKSRVAGNYKHAHIMADCGNPGCSRCHPRMKPLFIIKGLQYPYGN